MSPTFDVGSDPTPDLTFTAEGETDVMITIESTEAVTSAEGLSSTAKPAESSIDGTSDDESSTESPKATTDASPEEDEAITVDESDAEQEVVTESGDTVTESDDAVTESGDAVTERGDAVTESGDAVTGSGDAITESVEAITEIAMSTTPALEEGSCIKGQIVYENGTAVPASSPCEETCVCQDGVVKCDIQACPPAPPAFLRCSPIDQSDRCCPEYDCRKYTIPFVLYL